MARVLAAACFVLALGCARAGELAGRVIAVPDGDSIVVLDERRRQHRVRLAGIDAPEHGQRHFERAREHLGAMLRRRHVTVVWHKRDGYGRLVGLVLLEGRDVNREQIRAGYAWWYRAYAAEQTDETRASYRHAENEARRERRGLWAERSPVPPWTWRRAQ